MDPRKSINPLRPSKILGDQHFKGVPPEIKEELADMILGDDTSDRSSDLISIDVDGIRSDTDSDDNESTEDEEKFRTRRTYDKRDQYESNWWYVRYLANEEKREVLREDSTHRDTKEFKGLFHVSFTIFEDIVEFHELLKWYNNNRYDACGVKCSDVELLVLHSGLLWCASHNNNVTRNR